MKTLLKNGKEARPGMIVLALLSAAGGAPALVGVAHSVGDDGKINVQLPAPVPDGGVDVEGVNCMLLEDAWGALDKLVALQGELDNALSAKSAVLEQMQALTAELAQARERMAALEADLDYAEKELEGAKRSAETTPAPGPVAEVTRVLNETGGEGAAAPSEAPAAGAETSAGPQQEGVGAGK